MKTSFAQFGRFAVTAAVGALAIMVGWWLWDYYMNEPWTRDARIRADVVRVAADVSGVVTEVKVKDNQAVRKGDVLFVIDPERYKIALQQADAAVASRKVSLEQARRDLERFRQLNKGSVVSRQAAEQAETAAGQAQAAYQLALADRQLAQLNLARTEIKSPVNGRITNLDLRPGNYVSPSAAVAALVDNDSFYVVGYFEETKLPRIRVGDPVSIQVMGEKTSMRGHVEGLAAGIQDRTREASATMLANVNPTVSWVRLAQRVPVRIAIDDLPENFALISGRTATVRVFPVSPAAAPEARGYSNKAFKVASPKISAK
jgi:multidrug resistance efflux pump